MIYSNTQKMEFPASESTNANGVLSLPTANDPSLVRRLSGVYPISTFLGSNILLTWTDIKIGLDMNLTGLNHYYTKT